MEAEVFWKEMFTDFDEATPLAFGYGDKDTINSGSWEIPVVSERGLETFIATWALLLSRYSRESVVSMGFRNLKGRDVHVLRISVDEELPANEYLKSISSQFRYQTSIYPISESELRMLLQVSDELPLITNSVSLLPGNLFKVHGVGALSEETVSNVTKHLQRLIVELECKPTLKVHELEHLDEEEFNNLIRKWNPVPSLYPETSVQSLYERQAEERGDEMAVAFGSERLSYRELNERANRLARYLIGSGVLPGDRVAIFLERGTEQIVATLAILKAGAVYVPLDVEFPSDRTTMMLDDVEPSAIISSSALKDRLAVELLLIDQLPDLYSYSAVNPDVGNVPDDVAYVMFTSGSTGRPKGVEVCHRGIIRLLFGVDYVPLSSETVILHMAAVSFDASTFEIWGALLHGGLCVLCDSRVPTIEDIGRLLAAQNVNTFWMTAALFNLVIKEAPEILHPVKYLLVGGEALSPWHVEKALRELPQIQLINGYGPTENTTFSTTYAFERQTFDSKKSIPIGRAIGNSTCYILDHLLRPVPVGVPGELYVGGDGVARGYVRRPDLTAERFLDDPFTVCSGPRMYKTGDVAYWNREGFIEFIGRTDHQIKLRGFRIELQDIELVLALFPGVEQAVVEVYEDDVRGKWLAGFVKVTNPAEFSVDELEQFAYEKLPDYMVPAVLVPVDGWSYTPSGKLDRKALSRPLLGVRCCEDGDVRYVSKTETELAEIWSDVLAVEKIARTTGFFDLGGDSLRAVTLFLKIQRRFGKDLPLATLAHASTIADLANVIDGKESGPNLSAYRSLLVIQEGKKGVPPLFLIHGGQGNVLVFNNFVKRLDARQPVYAFQWSGWDGRRGESGIREMARAYKEELVRFHPAGAVRIGGYCIGGLIAIELALLLEREGRRVVPPLFVWDSPNMESVHRRKGEPWDSAQTIAAFNRMKAGLDAIRIETAFEPSFTTDTSYSPPVGKAALIRRIPGLMALLRMGKIFRKYLRSVPERAQVFAILVRRQVLPMERRSAYCLRTMVRAANRHRSSKYGGEILYFRSDCVLGRYMDLPGWWDDPFLGFAELCDGHFEAHAIGGTHTDVLEIPEMCELVNRVLERLEQDS
jgi:amino acid adenylation domain-containing protein